MREQLRTQLNVILDTRETARGLIVNLSDVLFDTGSATLKPGAREKLSRISGILASHQGLRVEVEGHTDNVGAEDYNQQLSERRGESVRTYLVQQGIASGAIGTTGLGEGTARCDQRHRRRTPAESTGRARRLRRHHRHALTTVGRPVARAPHLQEAPSGASYFFSFQLTELASVSVAGRLRVSASPRPRWPIRSVPSARATQ